MTIPLVYDHNGERILVVLPDVEAHQRYQRDRGRLWKGIARLNQEPAGESFERLAFAWLRNSSAFHQTYTPACVPSDLRSWTVKMRLAFNIDDAQFESNDFDTANGDGDGGAAIDCGGADEDDNDNDDPWAMAVEFQNVHGVPTALIHDVSSEITNDCAKCGKQSDINSMCPRCMQTMYCSAECQTEHWEEHKKTCTAPCGNCATRYNTNMDCSRCKRVSYCSKRCQKQHWKKHKKTCKAPNKAKKEDAK